MISFLFFALHLSSITTIELNCMALTIYHEARGETEQGQAAVGHVILNRVKSLRYPDNVCAVVAQKNSFSWYWDDKSDTITKPAKFKQILLLSTQLWNEAVPDNTHGATHYFNPDKADPVWARKMTYLVTLDNHRFYRRKK